MMGKPVMTGGGSGVLEEYTRALRQEKEMFVSMLVALGGRRRQKKGLWCEDIC